MLQACVCESLVEIIKGKSTNFNEGRVMKEEKRG